MFKEQESYIDFLNRYNWNFFATVSYKPKSYFREQVYNDLKVLNRWLSKTYKSKTSYFGIVVSHAGIIHVHILFNVKDADEDDLIDKRFLKWMHTSDDYMIESSNKLPLQRYVEDKSYVGKSIPYILRKNACIKRGVIFNPKHHRIDRNKYSVSKGIVYKNKSNKSIYSCTCYPIFRYENDVVIKYMFKSDHFKKLSSNVEVLPINRQLKVNKILKLDSVQEFNSDKLDLLDIFIKL